MLLSLTADEEGDEKAYDDLQYHPEGQEDLLPSHHLPARPEDDNQHLVEILNCNITVSHLISLKQLIHLDFLHVKDINTCTFSPFGPGRPMGPCGPWWPCKLRQIK